MANPILFIASGNAPLSSQFQETLEMLLTGAAFGQPTTLWLTDACLNQLALSPNATLAQLPDFGVRCVTGNQGPAAPIPAERLDANGLQALRDECNQIVVF